MGEADEFHLVSSSRLKSVSIERQSSFLADQWRVCNLSNIVLPSFTMPNNRKSREYDYTQTETAYHSKQ